MLAILISTLVTTFLIISQFKKTRGSFFNLSFIVTTPPLIGLIYYSVLTRFDIKIGQQELIEPIFNEISLKYCLSLISFILILIFVKIFCPSLVKVKNQILPEIKTSFLIYILFLFFESIVKVSDISIHLKILIYEASNISLILLISSVIIKLKIHKSIYKLLIIASISILIYFIFTFDKGFMISIFSSIFLILIGSKNSGLKINSLQTNILILLGSFFLPFLNFLEQLYKTIINKDLTIATDQTFKSLTEATESTFFTNYYHVFYNSNCKFDQPISIIETITSPFRAILGMDLSFYQHDFMKTCFPLQRAIGAGRGFGLITESAISNELPTFLYFSLASITFILIFEFVYYRFSLFGLIFYSQSIEIIYKLTRTDVASSIFSLIYTLLATLIIAKITLIIDPHINNFKKSF